MHLRKAAGVDKGATAPGKAAPIGRVTTSQLREIAAQKMQDLNTTKLESAMKTIEGTAKSMGLTVEG